LLAGFAVWQWFSDAQYSNSHHMVRSGQQRKDTHGRECPDYGCAIHPPEMDTVLQEIEAMNIEEHAVLNIFNRSKSERPYFSGRTMAMMTRRSNRQNPPKNQDASILLHPFITKQTPSPDDFLLAIFDGHGDEGHTVSQYVATALPELLAAKFNDAATLQSEEWIITTLKETFVQVDANAPPSAMMSRGGCTASVTLRRGSKLFIANAGDSRTIVVQVHGKQNDIVYMNRLDKAHLPDEKARIEGLGGKIHIPVRFPMGSRVIVYSKILQESVGLAMSRSIGDWEWKPVGVIAEPIVDVLNMDNLTNAFILAGSDGLWDARPRPMFFANFFAESFYHGGPSPFLTCYDVIQRASPKNASLYRDDISILAIKLRRR
jgi:serine/threonine protein phosphatase PrpC